MCFQGLEPTTWLERAFLMPRALNPMWFSVPKKLKLSIQNDMIRTTNAPVVKRISHDTSNVGFRVRILAGAPLYHTKKATVPLILKFL